MKGLGHEQHGRGVANIGCGDCHEMGAEKVKTPGTKQCKRCHEETTVAIHPRAPAGSPAVECVTCHAFLVPDGGVAHDRWSCLRCHDQPQGKVAAIVVHANERCADCHRPHTRPSASPRECLSCHRDREKAPKHAIHARANARPCNDCHKPHQPAKSLVAQCAACHRSQRERGPHKSISGGCSACHRANGGKTPRSLGCDRCHESQKLPSLHRVAEHRQCLACHGAHSLPQSSRPTCLSCHENRVGHHPEAALCSTCHAFKASR